jgi:hypothetical protein
MVFSNNMARGFDAELRSKGCLVSRSLYREELFPLNPPLPKGDFNPRFEKGRQGGFFITG